MLAQHVTVTIAAEEVQQPRRGLDVRKQERDSAARSHKHGQPNYDVNPSQVEDAPRFCGPDVERVPMCSIARRGWARPPTLVWNAEADGIPSVAYSLVSATVS